MAKLRGERPLRKEPEYGDFEVEIVWNDKGGRGRRAEVQGIAATLASHKQNGRPNAMHLYITRDVIEALENEWDRVAIGTVPGKSDFFALMPRRQGVKMVEYPSGGAWVSAGALKFHTPGRYEGRVVRDKEIHFKLVEE
ncbi:MAG: hypothetical protein KGL39_16460 [Patescibacteria group bacterium]|nr:hypothetical protein [Patescibacteria group bacterium]